MDPEVISPTLCNGNKGGTPKIIERVKGVARVNSSQDGKVVCPDDIAPTLCEGRYNVTKKLIKNED